MKLRNYIDFKEISKTKFYELLFFSFLFCAPIIYSQLFYRDDTLRSVLGYYGWSELGRYLVDNVAKIYSFGHHNTDTAPLTWLLSVFLLGVSSLIYIKYKLLDKKIALPLALIFICNPFYLSNLFYRFDCLGMTLAMFFVVLAFAINKNRFSNLLKVIFLVLSLNLYQSFINLFVGLIALEFFIMVYRGGNAKEIYKYLLLSAVIFMAANIIYLLELKISHIPSRGELLPISVYSISTIISNYFNAFKPFIDFWNYFSNVILVTIPFVCISIINIVYNRKFSVLISLIITSLLIIISSIGLLALMQTQDIGYRVLPYFPIVMMFIACILSLINKRIVWVMIIPLFACFVFSYRVGNINQIQTEFEKPILANLAMDINKVSREESVDNYHFIGSIPLSNRVKILRSNTPANGFLERQGWISIAIAMEYNKNLKIEYDQDELQRQFDKDNPELFVNRSSFYKIYINKANNEGFIIWQ